jgi:hypothetical protein
MLIPHVDGMLQSMKLPLWWNTYSTMEAISHYVSREVLCTCCLIFNLMLIKYGTQC